MTRHPESFYEAPRSFQDMNSEDQLDRRIEQTVDLQALSEKYSSFFVPWTQRFNAKESEVILRALGRLLVRLAPTLAAYDHIVSDETSARLLSLLIQETMRIKRNDHARVPITFAYSTGNAAADEKYAVGKQLSRQIAPEEHVLLVADYMDTGKSVRGLSDHLAALGIRHDLAALSLQKPIMFYSAIRAPEAIIYGEVGAAGLGFWQHRGAGVRKGNGDILRRKTDVLGSSVKQEDINRARATVRDLARDLAPVLSL